MSRENWVTCLRCNRDYIESIEDFPFTNYMCPYCGYPYIVYNWGYWEKLESTSNPRIYSFDTTGDNINWESSVRL